MTTQLRDDDRRAVDVVMDRTPSADGEVGVYVDPGHAPVERIYAVERVLSLLQAMPAAEPAPDLAARTMRWIEKAPRTSPAAAAPAIHAQH
jgi:hypothetical protein